MDTTEIGINASEKEITAHALRFVINNYITDKYTFKQLKGEKWTFEEKQNPASIHGIFNSKEEIMIFLKKIIIQNIKDDKVFKTAIETRQKITIKTIKENIAIDKEEAIDSAKLMDIQKKITEMQTALEKGRADIFQNDKELLQIYERQNESISLVTQNVISVATFKEKQKQTAALEFSAIQAGKQTEIAKEQLTETSRIGDAQLGFFVI